MALVAPAHSDYIPPRLGTPPEDVDLTAYQQATADIGLRHFAWELDAASAIYARTGDHWRFPEVCVVCSRRNGKTTLVKPRVIEGLRRGEKILHVAHNRALPRKAVFIPIVAQAKKLFPDLEPYVRLANGTEELSLSNGGVYEIASDRQGSGRGTGNDTIIIDELREQESDDLVAAVAPTIADSPDGQIIYLSNAGTDKSLTLNSLRDSRDTNPYLCYLEWSAAPEFDIADRDGWLQANPSLPFMPQMWKTLETAFLSRPAHVFETEHLCRWVTAMAEAVVTEMTWRHCVVSELEAPKRPGLGVALDPSGTRVSAYLGWQQSDGSVAVQPVLEIEDTIDVDAVGKQLRQLAMKNRARMTAYSGSTDVALAQYLSHAKPVDGRLHAQASSNFATLAESGKLRVISSELLDADLRYTVRKDHHDGAWSATRADENRPITSALAAIRAAWLASVAKPPPPRIG